VDKHQIHTLLPATPGQHFCIAPFQSTRQNAYGKNSPCAFGAGEWNHGTLTPAERWDSVELNQLRLQFVQGDKPQECHRCWDEEDAGKESLRQRQYQYFPNDYDEFIKTGLWLNGPKTAVFKTSNVCNLACRSCAGWDSNTYAKEGHYYAELYQTQDPKQGLHNRYIPLLSPKHMDFMRYIDIANNIEKIDFYGGEPLLNVTQLDLLEYLAEKGLSKKITLFYSTNCTNYPTDRLKRAWDKFKRVEFSMSIDGIGEQFEYMRWPGKWDEATQVINHIQNLKHSLNCEVYTIAGFTISMLNVLDVDQITDWLQNNIGDIYVNMVQFPDHLSLPIAPESVKSIIRSRIKHPEVLGYVDIKQSNPLAWKQFIIWTKRQDLYRQQNFSTVFPKLYNIVQADWDSITDLSEQNFYQL
jgi:sulfatase maturation enzyme AslB (radical SAM superfamily)